MAQQSFTISPPHPFWATGSQPTSKRLEWKNYFVNYIKAVDEADQMKPDQMKRLVTLPRASWIKELNLYG